jgi:hypothetical protein
MHPRVRGDSRDDQRGPPSTAAVMVEDLERSVPERFAEQAARLAGRLAMSGSVFVRAPRAASPPRVLRPRVQYTGGLRYGAIGHGLAPCTASAAGEEV